jgi:hypothetical protein
MQSTPATLIQAIRFRWSLASSSETGIVASRAGGCGYRPCPVPSVDPSPLEIIPLWLTFLLLTSTDMQKHRR